MTQPKTNVPPRFVRMKSGEDLISFAAPHMQHLELIYPYKVNYMLDPETASVMTLLTPWVTRGIVDVQLFEISMGDVLFMKDISPQMAKLYYETLAAYDEATSPAETVESVEANPVPEQAKQIPINATPEDESSYVNLSGVSDEDRRAFMANTSPPKRTLH